MGALDEGGVWRGDGVGGEVQVVGAGGREKAESVNDGDRDKEDGDWGGLQDM